MEHQNMIRVVVVGAGGYSGAELIGLLATHSCVQIAGLFGSTTRSKSGPARHFSREFPRWRGLVDGHSLVRSLPTVTQLLKIVVREK